MVLFWLVVFLILLMKTDLLDHVFHHEHRLIRDEDIERIIKELKVGLKPTGGEDVSKTRTGS